MSHKITVMHFVSGLKSGGVEQMIYNYCKNMDATKYRFVVVYQHDAVIDCLEKMKEFSYETIQITARCDDFCKNIIDSYKVIKTLKPDIVHAHMNLMNFCSLIPAYMLGIKVRISHSHIAENNRSMLYKIIAFFFKKLNVFFANHYMACGQEAGTYMYGKKRMCRDNSKVIIMPNAIDIDSFSRNEKKRLQVRKKLGVSDKFVVGNVGRFSKQKNHIRLIHIFMELQKKNTEAVLLLIGTGELEQQIIKEVEENNLNKHVIFWGTAPNIADLYSAMDIFVLPSLYEGLPVVSIEVQAAGIPSVLSDTIDQSLKLTDLITYVSLEKNNKEWADEILLAYNKKALNIDLSLLKKEYDITANAAKLEELYSSWFDKKNI